jgi:uncharacterized damage-inducible protein DinB
VIDDDAKAYLHDELRWIREATLAKLDGLGEYDIRRPLTAIGTNLLGLIKHLSTWEARYFGEAFSRPFPEPLPERGTDTWATEHETHTQIIERYRRVWEHSDATITSLDLSAPGHVPWWTQPDVTLFKILVHILAETNRHAGHADILREQLDGATGVDAETMARQESDTGFWENRRAEIERIAKASNPAKG